MHGPEASAAWRSAHAHVSAADAQSDDPVPMRRGVEPSPIATLRNLTSLQIRPHGRSTGIGTTKPRPTRRALRFKDRAGPACTGSETAETSSSCYWTILCLFGTFPQHSSKACTAGSYVRYGAVIYFSTLCDAGSATATPNNPGRRPGRPGCVRHMSARQEGAASLTARSSWSGAGLREVDV